MSAPAGWRTALLSFLRASALPAVTLAILLFMVVPVPALLLDLGFIFNIALSLGVLMVALGAQRALDFSSFPTVLLFATLLRLALNVASTRVVLVDGHTGSDAAGQVIEAFGHFLIGGDWLVGLLVFSILMVINLIVITKGAGRVSEVSARFTLDALPGKQMAIDADLGAGLIGPEDARTRRVEVATEAEFHGSMDGASKFVKGDAVAGVIILAINIIGGILVGVLGHDLPLGEAAEVYVLLAVGDALVAQVPALLLSIAAATIVTRVTSDHDLPGQLAAQFGSSGAWLPVAAILLLLGVIPGMPQLVLLPAAALCGALGWKLRQTERAQAARQGYVPPVVTDPSRIEWTEIGERAQVVIDIGYGLVPLVDEAQGAPLLMRITGLRRQLSHELGFVVPLVRVRDDLNLPPNGYRIAVGGVALAAGDVWPRDLMALDSGDAEPGLAGRPGKDPAFGLDALWIRPDQRADAVAAGYTVVDAPTVLATHLGLCLKRQAASLFGIDDARAWLDQLKQDAPQLVDALTPAPLPLTLLTSVLRALVHEAVPLRDARRIASALAETADPALGLIALTEATRLRLAPLIAQEVAPSPLPLPVMTLDSGLEGLIADSLRVAGGSDHPLEPQLAGRIAAAVRDASVTAAPLHGRMALVTTPAARPVLARLLRPHCPDLSVLSFLEVPEDRMVDVIAVVGGAAEPAAAAALPQPETVEDGEQA